MNTILEQYEDKINGNFSFFSNPCPYGRHKLWDARIPQLVDTGDSCGSTIVRSSWLSFVVVRDNAQHGGLLRKN